MIALFTDFGVAGPYVGQMQAVLCREAPGTPAINLFADAPAHDPRAAAYLLAAYVTEFPSGTVFLCVVDPGVGSARPGVILEADGRWFVGPGNGLFELVARRANGPIRWWDIQWVPEHLSASFHGRDLFAPIAARIGRGEYPEKSEWAVPIDGKATRCPEWPDDLAEIIYVDGFGNAMTGLRATELPESAVLVAGGRRIPRARTFSDVPRGDAFWYKNANGLAEIAVNQGRADQELEIDLGSPIIIETL